VRIVSKCVVGTQRKTLPWLDHNRFVVIDDRLDVDRAIRDVVRTFIYSVVTTVRSGLPASGGVLLGANRDDACRWAGKPGMRGNSDRAKRAGRGRVNLPFV